MAIMKKMDKPTKLWFAFLGFLLVLIIVAGVFKDNI